MSTRTVERSTLLKNAQRIIETAKTAGRELTDSEQNDVEAASTRIKALDVTIAKSKAAADLVARISGNVGTTARNAKASWAGQVASRVTETVGAYGVKAITTGGIDVPQIISPIVETPVLTPGRVLDLLSRAPLTGNEYEYLVQTARTNNAAPVADGGTKPTSVFTFEAVTDRARVFAHLSEPLPQRILADHAEVASVLGSQMAEDLYRALEADVLAGDGTGEHFTGLANTSGVLTQAYATSVLVSLRKARTALETAGETPTAWVLNFADLEAIDMTVDGDGNYMDGIEDKVFGGLPRIGSANVPAGTAYVGDWSQAKVFIRETGRLDADMSGGLFETNEVRLRYEGRFGFAVLRPSAFSIVDLTA